MSSLGSIRRKVSGFTLTELLVTISITAIVAIIAAPSISSQMANRRIKNAAFELQSSIQQARSLSATAGRPIEMWPAYSPSWNVVAASRGATISIPNASDVSKTSLINAKLSWYVVTPGAALGTSPVGIADSTANNFPIQVSLPDQTLITVTTLPSTASPDATKGIRFFPGSSIGNIPTSGTTISSVFTQVTFKVCDKSNANTSGYSVIVNQFGVVRSVGGTPCH